MFHYFFFFWQSIITLSICGLNVQITWLQMVTTQRSFCPKDDFCTHAQMTWLTFKTRKIQAFTAIYMQRFQWMSTASSDPGSVSRASNSQQAMWESTHQQVSVKSAAGSQARCLLLFLRLRPSLPVCLLTVGQCLRLYGGVSRSIVPRLLFWNALMSWHRAGRSGPAIWSRGSAVS